MVLKYENDTGNWANNRLRIRKMMGPMALIVMRPLLIRDPNDQWQFVDDLAGFGWNAGLELAHAQSGNYTIWAGSLVGAPAELKICVSSITDARPDCAKAGRKARSSLRHWTNFRG